MSTILYLIPALGLVGLAYMVYIALWVNKRDAGNEKMQGIAKNIADGAMAFLKAEYRVLLIYVGITAGLLAWLASTSERSDPMVAVSIYYWLCIFRFSRLYWYENRY
jgi:K(+)-stimulated pyrophosphate-energized sodium pump